ncbi:rac GTPase-activating protein 1-like isoform X3 [Portunus trituberculatus]|uniref:rac GTPase-activating protein 1-like isoform X3 n=1 Tax=Portunus trituberculatus TaxID=210409 RepID=UPI001E1CFE28|nr:rac GTPase-activating protein 1-like isoform X3 [Portunus trituberculatus]
MDSLTRQFDDLIRTMKLLSDPAEKKFLEFTEGVEGQQREWQGLAGEVQRLQEQVNQSQKTIKNLEMKLKNARHLLDLEKGRRIAAENEKRDMAGQILLAVEMLAQGQVVKTKERLEQLQHSFSSEAPGQGHGLSRQHSPNGPLSTITEDHDSIGTILNVSQMNITEEDELEDSRLRSGRSYKRKSSPDRLDRSSGAGRKRLSGRKSGGEGKENKHSLEVKTEVTCYTEGDELKGVKVDIQPSAPPYLSIIGEDMMSPLKKPPRTPAPPPPTPAAGNRQGMLSPSVNYNYINLGTPVTPQHQAYSTPTSTPHTPALRNYSSASKVNGRTHAFVLKTSYKIDHCQPCGKRIKFAKACLKCRDCRAICHTECREQVPLPCVPTANTPNKGPMGTIADYAPSAPPMVPALVVHCTNEVENRGLTEVGIYRLCGSEKDIKELKEQFLRGRGLPNLSQLDIHVVSGTLKIFLRSLKEPLITTVLWKDFTLAAREANQDCTASLYQAISELPQPNRDTLAWIIAHLQRVAECPECKMPVTNLAKVFGPTLVGYSSAEPEMHTMMQETRLQQLVMEKLLEISSDYWNSFIQVADENTQPIEPRTPDFGGSMLGGVPRSTSRRRSQLFRTPLQSRDSNSHHPRK